MQHMLDPFDPHLFVPFVSAFKLNYPISSSYCKIGHLLVILRLTSRPCWDVTIYIRDYACTQEKTIQITVEDIWSNSSPVTVKLFFLTFLFLSECSSHVLAFHFSHNLFHYIGLTFFECYENMAVFKIFTCKFEFMLNETSFQWRSPVKTMILLS